VCQVACRAPRPTTVPAASALGWHSNGMPGIIRRVAPFGVLALGPAAMAFVSLQPEPQLSIAGKIAVSAYSICFYVWKTLVPINLSPLYAMPERVDALQPAFLLAIAGAVLGIDPFDQPNVEEAKQLTRDVLAKAERGESIADQRVELWLCHPPGLRIDVLEPELEHPGFMGPTAHAKPSLSPAMARTAASSRLMACGSSFRLPK